MPYNRDEIVAAVTDYYHFLTSLHVNPADIKPPPPSGWPDITTETCNKLSQTDVVISLLKHLPYITNEDNFNPTLFWWMSGCNDYTFHEFQTGHTGTPTSADLEDCPWEKLREPEPRVHVVHLACPAVSQTLVGPIGSQHSTSNSEYCTDTAYRASMGTTYPSTLPMARSPSGTRGCLATIPSCFSRPLAIVLRT
jgi:hypothetical protein